MTPLFREMLQTLQDAMASMESELELLSKAEAIGQPSLQRLAEVSADFYVQADGLLDMMMERGAAPEMIGLADELVTYFEDTAERLERLAQVSGSA
jgi:hypothetical protein